jgi:hypothetical protein
MNLLVQEWSRWRPQFQDHERRAALLDIARVRLRMAESYKDAKSILLAATQGLGQL